MDNKSETQNPKHETKRFLPTLVFFVTLSLIAQLVIISSKTRSTAKNTIVSKAAGNSSASFGFNIHSLPLLSPNEISQTLSMVSQCGDTGLIRFWGFSGGDNIGKVLDNAPPNMKFVVTLSNFYQSGVNQPWPAPQGNETEWYSSDWKTNGYQTFIDQVTKKYSNSPKILIWELMNEPNCSADSACSQAQHQFFRDASAIITKNSPKTLISPGTQAQETGGEHFENGDFEDIASIPTITALSCHIQVDDSSLNQSKKNCVTALEITKSYNKYFYTGEFGENLHCTEGCINTCSPEELQARKNEMLSVTNELNALGNDATLVWQFSPEQNPTLSCDGSSVFPKDPFCSINGDTKLNDTKNNNQQQTTNTATTINFNPQNPIANSEFKVIITSRTGFTWVHMKIFDTDGKKLIQEGGKTADQPKVSKTNSGYQWTYDAKALPDGKYKVIFYSGCDKECKEQSFQSLSIGAGTTNETQTKTTTNQQQFNIPYKVNEPGQITFLKTDLNKIGNGIDVDYTTAEYCYSVTEKDRHCQKAQTNITNDTITIVYPKDNPPQGFCFALQNNISAKSICIYKP